MGAADAGKSRIEPGPGGRVAADAAGADTIVGAVHAAAAAAPEPIRNDRRLVPSSVIAVLPRPCAPRRPPPVASGADSDTTVAGPGRRSPGEPRVRPDRGRDG